MSSPEVFYLGSDSSDMDSVRSFPNIEDIDPELFSDGYETDREMSPDDFDRSYFDDNARPHLDTPDSDSSLNGLSISSIGNISGISNISSVESVGMIREEAGELSSIEHMVMVGEEAGGLSAVEAMVMTEEANGCEERVDVNPEQSDQEDTPQGVMELQGKDPPKEEMKPQAGTSCEIKRTVVPPELTVIAEEAQDEFVMAAIREIVHFRGKLIIQVTNMDRDVGEITKMVHSLMDQIEGKENLSALEVHAGCVEIVFAPSRWKKKEEEKKNRDEDRNPVYTDWRELVLYDEHTRKMLAHYINLEELDRKVLPKYWNFQNSQNENLELSNLAQEQQRASAEESNPETSRTSEENQELHNLGAGTSNATAQVTRRFGYSNDDMLYCVPTKSLKRSSNEMEDEDEIINCKCSRKRNPYVFRELSTDFSMKCLTESNVQDDKKDRDNEEGDDEEMSET